MKKALARFKITTSESPWQRSYFLAMLIASLAVYFQVILLPWAQRIHFLLLYPAVFLVAWLLGWGPAVFATFICVLGASYFFFRPTDNLLISEPASMVRVSVFIILSLLLNWLINKGQQKLRSTEEFLRFERDKFRAIINNLDVGLGLANPEGKILSLNPAGLRIHGFRSEKEMPTTVQEYDQEFELQDSHGNSLPPPQWPLSRAVTGDYIGNYELKLIRRGNGEAKYIIFSAVPVHNSQGELTYIAFHLQDITDRKKFEEELLHQMNITQTITDNAGSALFLTDENGFPTFMNPAAESHFGYKLGEIKERPLHDSIHYKKPDGSPFPISECPIDGAQYELRPIQNQETTVVTKDGRLFPASFSISPLSKDGKIIGSVREFNDLTDIKKAEAEVRESEERFRSMANSLPQLLWMSDPQGHIFWYNQKALEYTGMKMDELVGFGWKNIHHPEHAERVIAKFENALKSGQPWEDVFPLKNRKGEWHWFLSRALPIRNDKGEIQRWFGSNTDITDQLKTQDDLKAAVASRDEFLSIASHELKTPLASLKLQTQLFQRAFRKGDEQFLQPGRIKRLVEQTDRQTSRLNRLVDDMLDIGRIRSGKLSIHPEKLSFCELVSDVIDRMRPVMQHAHTPVDFECHNSDLEVMLDGYRMEQVVNNLLTNAMRYGEKKPVKVCLEKAGDQARLQVQDQGRGISPESHKKIFERFERAVSYNEVSGLGLGLFISTQIVEAHGGKIRVKSEGAGKGATFIVELPLAKMNETSAGGIHDM